MKRTNRIKLALHRGVSRAFLLGPLAFLMVAGAGCPSLFESTTHRETRIRQAVVGKDGPGHITAAATVVNVYAQLSLAAVDPVAGDRTITVTDVNSNFLSAVSKNDLLLIVQMAGATIDTSDTAAYGAFTVPNLGSAGRYEFVGVEGVLSGVITLSCRLKNGYSRNGKTQVIRVPQYTTLTIDSAASIVAGPDPLVGWNGVTGGVVAVHAQSTVTVNGSIDASARGFRGGAVDNTTSDPTTAGLFSSAAATDGAEKGEGIAGYGIEYDDPTTPTKLYGRYGRGAPANGGGGGNAHNAGGGGGANAGNLPTWTGQGVMELCTGADTTWLEGWKLDPGYAGCSTADGGGRGGYSWSANDLNALTAAGAPELPAWGGNNRRDVGGLGGRPVPNDPASRLFLATATMGLPAARAGRVAAWCS